MAVFKHMTSGDHRFPRDVQQPSSFTLRGCGNFHMLQRTIGSNVEATIGGAKIGVNVYRAV